MSPRRRIVLGAALAALLAVLAAVGVRLLGREAPPARPDQARPGPVLLVPGYGGSRTGLTRLAERLRATGRSATVLTLPGDGTGDLLAQAATVDAAVTAALAAGAPSVDVLGYSAGGVAVKLWVDRHRSAAAARRIVTLGSPLHGTRLAGAGAALAPGSCPAACRQLAPGSALLESLAEQPVPEGLPWLSIWTDDDETVQPPDSARLDGATNLAVQTLCPGVRVSHGALPTDPIVTALVLDALGAPAWSAPTGCPG
ncbi:lipase [Amorphoplanes nipponensis]|uniref:Lipase n=1 Tax=Actinoplanes nipponensis TaxID=135950 RepID=A0A919MGZ7_9ACTN|nr:lipase [Actinoplanes nipponensis]GIE49129.1 lipase [Actinoplanes nipponensis]